MSSLATDSPSGIVQVMINAYNDSQRRAAEMYWAALINFLSLHTIAIVLSLIGILVFSLVIYVLSSRWAMLGSVLWHYLYFGILFVAGLLWGPVIFVSDIFHKVCVIVLYPACYFLVRIILTEMGIRKL
jgi:hypothetical protein